jgi:Phage capsid family
VPPVTAQGSAANTGGSETGATSLGSVDFAAAYEALDAAYLASPKCAWAMSNKTLGYLLTIVDKYGNPLRLVQFVDGVPTIFGKKVIVCPSMPSVGVSQIPVILGDFSYFATRIITDDSTGIKTFTEAPGLAENGKVALRTFLRADSKVLWTDTSSPCPFVQRPQLRTSTGTESEDPVAKVSSGPLLSPGTEVKGNSNHFLQSMELPAFVPRSAVGRIEA